MLKQEKKTKALAM